MRKMEKTMQYMTVKECLFYREFFGKYGVPSLAMAPSLPQCEPYLKVRVSSTKRKVAKRK